MGDVKRSGGYTHNACVKCRAAKVKCDGKTPICSRCLSKGFDCEYQKQTPRGPRPKVKEFYENLSIKTVWEPPSKNNHSRSLIQLPAPKGISGSYFDVHLAEPTIKNYLQWYINEQHAVFPWMDLEFRRKTGYIEWYRYCSTTSKFDPAILNSEKLIDLCIHGMTLYYGIWLYGNVETYNVYRQKIADMMTNIIKIEPTPDNAERLCMCLNTYSTIITGTLMLDPTQAQEIAAQCLSRCIDIVDRFPEKISENFRAYLLSFIVSNISGDFSPEEADKQRSRFLHRLLKKHPTDILHTGVISATSIFRWLVFHYIARGKNNLDHIQLISIFGDFVEGEFKRQPAVNLVEQLSERSFFGAKACLSMIQRDRQKAVHYAHLSLSYLPELTGYDFELVGNMGIGFLQALIVLDQYDKAEFVKYYDQLSSAKLSHGLQAVKDYVMGTMLNKAGELSSGAPADDEEENSVEQAPLFLEESSVSLLHNEPEFFLGPEMD
eukprot:TRINITY_DN3067_c0_g1_i1.p1 TRINITY_DN3067_c0_g1~~TRINITY_DN3067_c0_g1_i1.p1  ORF type:complete len:552 (-),score=76.41 TRINITY_DN3067_c0_g1_i1:124-1599(-)